jgi:uncharacterized membrane protein
MKWWIDRIKMSHWRTMVSLVLLTALFLASVQGQEAIFGQRIILNVYLDNTGKALVTGYAENISGLVFLNTSVYRFENDTNQIYALTDGLTTKNSDLWTLRFNSIGYYDDYRVTFYLPSDMKLGKINVSDGLRYLLSASNESIVADVQGYEVSDPIIAIQYQQPLAVNSGLPLATPLGNYPTSLNFVMILIAAALLIAGFAIAVNMKRRKDKSLKDASPMARADVTTRSEGQSAPKMSEVPPSVPKNDSDSLEKIALPQSDQADDGVYFTGESQSSENTKTSQFPEDKTSNADSSEADLSHKSPHSMAISSKEANSPLIDNIVISSEMEAVMQTLTAREHAVLTTLIEHGGRMTQAEIRYETSTPKSSLTGILISLERRKLITKKEWGRTNIIELSSWFLSKKEPS